MTTNVSPVVLVNPPTGNAQLTTGAVTYITGVAGSQTIIKRVVFSNVTATAATITVWRVPTGGTAGATNQIISVQSVAANSTYLAPELANMVLNGGDVIQALASVAATVDIFGSGYVAT